MEARMGRSQHSFAASTAARVSWRSVIVSIKIRSAPAGTPAWTTSLNIWTASSKCRVPVGSKSWPMGPKSSATRAWSPAACLAIATVGGTTSATVLPVRASFSRLAPKVLALMIWAPA